MYRRHNSIGAFLVIDMHVIIIILIVKYIESEKRTDAETFGSVYNTDSFAVTKNRLKYLLRVGQADDEKRGPPLLCRWSHKPTARDLCIDLTERMDGRMDGWTDGRTGIGTIVHRFSL